MRLGDGAALVVSLRWSAEQVERVGRLAWRDQRAWFEYDAAFLVRGLSISPLGLPARAGVMAGEPRLAGIHGVFADSLPDAWGQLLVDRQAQRLAILPTTLTPLDRLAVVGQRGMGALVYEPETVLAASEGAATLDDLARYAKALLQGPADAVLDELLAAGGSPGGARPKVLVGWQQGDGSITHGQVDVPAGYEPTLVKFPAPSDPDDIGAIELAYHQMAQQARLRVSSSRLLPAATGPGYFATLRFDRDTDRPDHRLHAHTLAGLLGADYRVPSLDYDHLLRVTSRLTRDQREVEMAFRYAVFNVLACNRDDHGKQFSFVMDRRGSWRLAPAYDLTFSEGPGGQHSTTVVGEGTAPGMSHLDELAKRFSVRKHGQIVAQVRDAVTRWDVVARRCGVGPASRARIGRVLVGLAQPL